MLCCKLNITFNHATKMFSSECNIHIIPWPYVALNLASSLVYSLPCQLAHHSTLFHSALGCQHLTFMPLSTIPLPFGFWICLAKRSHQQEVRGKVEKEIKKLSPLTVSCRPWSGPDFIHYWRWPSVTVPALTPVSDNHSLSLLSQARGCKDFPLLLVLGHLVIFVGLS
jgi:hypothetical protein